MKLYVYFLTESITLDQLPPGISDLAVRILTIDDFAVLVSDFDSDAVTITRENALAHAAVVRSVLDRTTPLPFRFGTLVTEQQLRSYIAAHKPSLKTNLDLVRGCVEMSVKIIWQNSSETESEAELAIPDLDQVGAGTAFLMFKRQELIGNERLEQQAHDLGDWLRGGLKDVVHQEQVTIEPRQRLVVSASYLVERARLPDYRRELAKLQAERSTLHFLSSGPWPPYTFANIDLEFGTHFGVS